LKFENPKAHLLLIGHTTYYLKLTSVLQAGWCRDQLAQKNRPSARRPPCTLPFLSHPHTHTHPIPTAHPIVVQWCRNEINFM